MRVLLVSFLVLVVSASAAAQTSYLPLASWLNDAAHQRDGDRVVAVLHAAGIEGVATCSAGCTLSVSSSDYARAIALAEAAIAREHLDVTMLAALPSS